MWPGEISTDLFKLNDRFFWLVWPSSVDSNLCDHVFSPIMIYEIVLFRRSEFSQSCYFIDRDLHNRVILAGPMFEPRAKKYDFLFLVVLDSIPRPDCQFQASVIHGLCQSFAPSTLLQHFLCYWSHWTSLPNHNWNHLSHLHPALLFTCVQSCHLLPDLSQQSMQGSLVQRHAQGWD